MKFVILFLFSFSIDSVSSLTKPINYKPVLKIESKLLPIDSTPIYSNKQTNIFVKNGSIVKKGQKIASYFKNKKEIITYAPFTCYFKISTDKKYLGIIYDFSTIRIPLFPENESIALYDQIKACSFNYNDKSRSCTLNKINDLYYVYVDNKNYKIFPIEGKTASIILDVPIQKNVYIFPKEEVSRNRFVILDTPNGKLKFYLSRYSMDNKNFIVYEQINTAKTLF